MIPVLGLEAGATVVIILLMLVALVKEVARPDLILLASLGALLCLGILTPEEAFAGFSNKAVLAVGALFVVAAGVQNTGALQFTDRLIFPASAHIQWAMLRLMSIVAIMSAFLNNTPLVAMLIPRVQAWCEKVNVPVSKMMIPLSFATIVGGMTTLIGTSTNLLVAGMMEDAGFEGLGLFDFTGVGVPMAVAVILYFTFIGHRMLPDRRKELPRFEEGLRHCIFEVQVAPDSLLVGKSVEQAGLRALQEAYLVHLRRGPNIMVVSPETVLQGGDILSFLGSAGMIDQMLQYPGLKRVQQHVDGPASLPLFEAVVAPSSRLVGQSLHDVGFREAYQGVVLGIYRREKVIEGPLSRIPLKAGDLLLIEARSGFDTRWNQNRDEFYLVAPRRLEKVRQQNHKGPIALAILVGVVLVAALGMADIVTTAFIGALGMILTGCIRGGEVRRAIDIPVLIVIASALGISRAIEGTGLAAALAQVIIAVAAPLGPVGAVALVFITTSLLTEVITNNAAAALMLGMGLAASQTLGVSPEAFAIAVAIGASSSFLTPIGYQTNLMVMSAGGYRFADFFKVGFLINLIVALVGILMIWWIWL